MHARREPLHQPGPVATQPEVASDGGRAPKGAPMLKIYGALLSPSCGRSGACSPRSRSPTSSSPRTRSTRAASSCAGARSAASRRWRTSRADARRQHRHRRVPRGTVPDPRPLPARSLRPRPGALVRRVRRRRHGAQPDREGVLSARHQREAHQGRMRRGDRAERAEGAPDLPRVPRRRARWPASTWSRRPSRSRT